MPILHVKALPQENNQIINKAIKKTALEIAKVYECSPKHVWITWQELIPSFYVEGDEDKLIQPKNTHPPICELICFEGKGPSQVEEVLKVAAKTLSKELNIPDNIFITYREAKSGEVIAGDGIVRKN